MTLRHMFLKCNSLSSQSTVASTLLIFGISPDAEEGPSENRWRPRPIDRPAHDASPINSRDASANCPTLNSCQSSVGTNRSRSSSMACRSGVVVTITTSGNTPSCMPCSWPLARYRRYASIFDRITARDWLARRYQLHKVTFDHKQALTVYAVYFIVITLLTVLATQGHR
jgi:hypothetical protein